MSHFVCVLEKCASTFQSLPILISLFAFMSQVHYFVIFINQKSRALTHTLTWVQKLNITFKSQFPQWDYANQSLPVSPFCFHSSLIYPPTPWCISSYAMVYSIHLNTSFFMFNSPTYVFPLCIVTLTRANLCVCFCVLVSANTGLLPSGFQLKEKKN